MELVGNKFNQFLQWLSNEEVSLSSTYLLEACIVCRVPKDALHATVLDPYLIGVPWIISVIF